MNYYSSRLFGSILNSIKSPRHRSKTIKLTAIAVTSLTIAQGSSPVSAALEDSPKNVIDEVWQIVNNEFVDRRFNHVDWKVKRQELLQKEYTDRESAYKAIRESLKGLDDPYTRFLEPEEYEDLTSQNHRGTVRNRHSLGNG